MITLDITGYDWDAQVRTMLRQLNLERGPFVRTQLRLLLEKIIAFTPPKTLTQGVVRVRADLAKTAKPFNVSEFRNPRLKRIVETRNYAAFEAFFRHAKSDAMKSAFAVTWQPEIHRRARDRRGRVLTGNRGRLFVIGRADTSALKRYQKEKVANVGIAAAGWLAALRLAGGDEVAWVTRHGTRYGSVVDELVSEENPSITAINSTPWASRRDEGQRIVRNAMRSRANAMRSALRKQLELAAKKAGLAA